MVFMHAGDMAVRKVSYVTTFKKQVIGPKEAKATEVYESKLVLDQRFTVDVKVHTPEVCALLLRPSMPGPDPRSPFPCILECQQEATADRQGIPRCLPSVLAAGQDACNLGQCPCDAGAVWEQLPFAPAVGCSERGPQTDQIASVLRGGLARFIPASARSVSPTSSRIPTSSFPPKTLQHERSQALGEGIVGACCSTFQK
jgi:hypothetical protein